MHDLATLLERVEKATRKSDDLDQHIFAWHRGWSFPLFGAARQEWNEALRHGILVDYTASLDAALALVEEKLPGKYWYVAAGRARVGEPLYGAQIVGHRENGVAIDEPIGLAEHEHGAALAILAALLRALLTQESKNG